MKSAESIASNGGVLTKIYVRPQVFAVSSALASLVNFLIGMIPLTIVCAISGQHLAWTFPLVIFVGFFMVLFVADLGLSLSILFIRFDDTRNIVAILLMVLMHGTPIFYPISILSSRMQSIVCLNPLTSYLDCFRWSFSSISAATGFDWVYVVISGTISIWMGTALFKKYWPRTVVLL